MAAKALPSPEVLRQLLDYDPETGTLTWRARDVSFFASAKYPSRRAASWNGRHAGKDAFTCKQHWGHRTGSVLGVFILAHRVAWAIYYGAWPSKDIDHIDGDSSNNRILNLRQATPEENSRNRKLAVTNTSGVMGVTRAGKKWRAQISHKSRSIDLGRYSRFEDAVVARREAERMLGYHENHGRTA